MSDIDRRRFLKRLLGSLAQVAGVVVVASATASRAGAADKPTESAMTPAPDVKERADRLAESCKQPPDPSETEPVSFLNGAFRNTPLGAFRNAPFGAFRNAPLGAFRNAPLGAFRNTPLGSFGNGGWPNGHWGGFGNGGWPNVGWHNWW